MENKLKNFEESLKAAFLSPKKQRDDLSESKDEMVETFDKYFKPSKEHVNFFYQTWLNNIKDAQI